MEGGLLVTRALAILLLLYGAAQAQTPPQGTSGVDLRKNAALAPAPVGSARIKFNGVSTTLSQSGGPPINLVTQNQVAYPVNYTPGNATRIEPTGYLQEVQLGDMNKDGKLDRVLYDNGINSLEIQLGNGDGTLQAISVIDSAASKIADKFLLRDIDNDGNLDIVSVYGDGISAIKVRFYAGHGDGTFASAVLSTIDAVNSFARGLQLADWDGDGKLDVFTTSALGSVKFEIAKGAGDGTFGVASQFPVGGSAGLTEGVFAGDFDGDGKLDVACLIFAGSGSVTISLGNGAGGFASPVAYGAASGTFFGDVGGDLNSDGVPDIVYRDQVSAQVHVLLGKTWAVSTYATATAIAPVLVRDVNGDGVLDVIALEDPTAIAGDEFSILLGKGDGTFGSAKTFTRPYMSESMSGVYFDTGDLNGDGRVDIALGDHDEGTIFLNTAATVSSYNTTPAFDCTSGRANSITLTGNLGSWKVSQGKPGDICVLNFVQGAGASTIGTPPTNIVWANAVPVLSTAIGALDSFSLVAVSNPLLDDEQTTNTTGQQTVWREFSRCVNCMASTAQPSIPMSPLPPYVNGSRPAASTMQYRMIYNTTSNAINISDGTNWRDAVGNIAP